LTKYWLLFPGTVYITTPCSPIYTKWGYKKFVLYPTMKFVAPPLHLGPPIATMPSVRDRQTDRRQHDIRSQCVQYERQKLLKYIMHTMKNHQANKALNSECQQAWHWRTTPN